MLFKEMSCLINEIHLLSSLCPKDMYMHVINKNLQEASEKVEKKDAS